MRSMNAKRFFKIAEEIKLAGQQREIARQHYDANEWLLKQMRELLAEYKGLINWYEEQEFSLDELQEMFEEEEDD